MPARRSGMGGARHIRGGRPAARSRGVVHRTTARPVIRRGASPKRNQTRTIRRQAVRKTASTIAARPRPVVRPTATPRKVMSTAVSRKTTARSMARPSRMVRPSSRMLKRGGMGAGLAAAAAGAFLTLNSQSASPEISNDVISLQSSLNEMQDRASLTELQADVTNLDANLSHALSLLESARDKGYKYQKDLEQIACDAMSRWQTIREDVEIKINAQANLMQGSLNAVDGAVQQLNAVIGGTGAASALSSVQNELSRAMGSIRDAEYNLEKSYSDIESAAAQLNSRLTQIHWMLTQQEEASFAFNGDEDLYRAVKARWDQEGKDDPEGVLFLTNQRLIFERKEKIATKKILFVTTASEVVQAISLDHKLADVKGVKAHNKGLFGHQDFLDVTYSDQSVPFHIDGQDSEDWGRWIKDAQSGKIEEDRATGTGLSFADLTGDLTEADIVEAQGEVNELQDEMMLKNLQEELAQLENRTNELSQELAELRGRGYQVEKNLEADIQILVSQWEKIKARANATLEYQTKNLGEQMTAIQAQMKELAGMTGNLVAARPMYVQLKSAIASAEAQAEAAEETVLDQYDEYADEVESLDAHFEWVDWMLDALETASFQLLATESGVAAVEAVWERPGLDPENGILFLTDQRFLWEDRVGDYELKINVPVSEVREVKEQVDEESGLEQILVSFGSGAPVDKGHFELSQPVAEEWVQMVGRARSDGYAGDRAVEIKEADLERIRNAPSQCSNCGAAYTAPILRGQKEITCEFCGVSVRI